MNGRRARIGHSDFFPPFAEVKDGTSQGLAIDILTAAAAHVAVEIEWVPVPFEQLHSTLDRGRAQAIFPLGITPERRVVVYEDDCGMRAARVYWLLEYLSHPNVQVLNGGLRAWMRAGLPLSTAVTTPKPSTWHGTPTPAAIASWRDVNARLGRPETAIIDTRSDDEYRGTVARAKRGGAIPGAVHIEWTRNLNPDGTFKSAEALTAMYGDAGVTPDREVITYCQGGYRAAHAYLALRLIGYPRVRNYTGSWKEWGDRDDVPVSSAIGNR